MRVIQQKLHQWYHDNKRDLPWRHTTDAYRIWVSEIMLQQTQVVQGLPYYLRFMERFDTVQDLASAAEDEVLKLWQGLGYYSRARNLHFAAKQVVNDYEGVFPTSYDELMTLKGVGDYTASAVSAFASGEARPCIDGNVIRVVTRLFGVDEPYDTSVGQKLIRSFAEELLFRDDSALHNQAMMEFGALQCVPKNTQCNECVLNHHCVAYAKGNVSLLPVKSKKTKVKDLFLYYFVFSHQNTVVVRQRSESGIWKNLYDFPLVESDMKLKKQDLLERMEQEMMLGKNAVVSFSKTYTHILSHRRIQAVFVEVAQAYPKPLDANETLVTYAAFDEYPVSRLIERFWDDFSKAT